MLRKLLLIIGIAISCQTLQGCAPAVVATTATAGAVIAADRRDTEAVLRDQAIKFKANDAIYSDEVLGTQVHVTVTVYNGRVLLTGEVPRPEMRDEVEALVERITHVASVYNELAVTPRSNQASRSRDAMITATLKGRLLRNSEVDPTKIKVITERSDVYLMGIVTEQEAETTVAIARQVDNVNKVVKVFEYVTIEEPPEIEQEIIPDTQDDEQLMRQLEVIDNISAQPRPLTP